MLSDRELELIHGDVDGALSTTEQAALDQLLRTNPEAAALSNDLHRLNAVFARVPERAPATTFVPERPVVQRPRPSLFTLAVQRLEEVLMSRKLFLIGATTVAIIAVVAGAILPFPPTGQEVGTIGGTEPGSSEIGGVQKADRYRGRSMSEKDVSISNPEIATLFQNHDILTLVKSDAFRETMKSDAFRVLQANDAFRAMAASDAFRVAMNSDAFARLQQSEAYRVALAKEASNAEAFRMVMANDAFRAMAANESFRMLMANESFRVLMASDAFRRVAANDAFRVLQNSEAFRSMARNAQLSELFLTEASRQRE